MRADMWLGKTAEPEPETRAPLRALLVTGSRALADDREAHQWAWETLIREFYRWRPDLVLNGGARGPDAWSSRLARIVGVPCYELLLDGTVGVVGAPHADYAPGRDGRWHSTAADPLTRNRALVTACDELVTQLATVRVLALLSPDSSTRGTAHTVGLARRAGLEVAEEHFGG